MFSNNCEKKVWLVCIPLARYLILITRELQGNGNEYGNSSTHVRNAPNIDQKGDNEITQFLNKYVICSLADLTWLSWIISQRRSISYLLKKESLNLQIQCPTARENFLLFYVKIMTRKDLNIIVLGRDPVKNSSIWWLI